MRMDPNNSKAQDFIKGAAVGTPRKAAMSGRMVNAQWMAENTFPRKAWPHGAPIIPVTNPVPVLNIHCVTRASSTGWAQLGGTHQALASTCTVRVKGVVVHYTYTGMRSNSDRFHSGCSTTPGRMSQMVRLSTVPCAVKC